jgi:sialate O-acetylesterase
MKQRFFYAAMSTAAITATTTARAEVTLPRLFSDKCVLQASAPIPVYGTAEPDETVTVSFKEQKVTATADATGKWRVTLKAEKPSETPSTLTVTGAKNSVTVKDVLVGEVWICSGQSNMEWPLGSAENGAAEAKAANDPALRMFTVPKRPLPKPASDLDGGEWQPAAPNTASAFSAVGYYFAKALRETRKVPIGMIHTSWGGTRMQAWTNRETLLAAGFPKTEFAILDTPDDPKEKAKRDVAQKRYDEHFAAYKAAGSPTGNFDDPGVAATAKDWHAAAWDDSAWVTVAAPGAWEKSGIAELEAIDGGVWFRKTFIVSEADVGKSARLSLGAVDDFDTTFVNGVKVGAIGKETESFWTAPRNYAVPAGLLKAGANTIAVRIWDHMGGGGFMGIADDMLLTIDNGAKVPLAGEWRYKIEVSRPSMPQPVTALDANTATVLYNGMLAPLAPYGVRGFLWYQGESNAWEPETQRYKVFLPAMVQNWRTDFQNPNTPFLIVQLAPYKADKAENTGWAFFREAQNEASANIPLSGVAVITDAGDVDDIHPRKKKPVGERLAILARRIAYKEKVVSSPIVKDWEREASTMLVKFADVGAGLTVPKEARGILTGWEIAGGDGKYFPAVASITSKNKDAVRVYSPEVPYPFHVRYGWRNVPDGNLFNSEGLPASPFRTDVPLIPVPGK